MGASVEFLGPVNPGPVPVETNLNTAVQFWDETEEILKRAEQIDGQMVSPAISELRYAGRKLVDFVRATAQSDDSAERVTHLEDFLQCCVRARHDAIDAVISHIVIYLERLEQRVDADLIRDNFADYLDLKVYLRTALADISQSRRDRELRNDVYTNLQKEGLDQALDRLAALKILEADLFALQHRRNLARNVTSWVVSTALASVCVAAILFVIT